MASSRVFSKRNNDAKDFILHAIEEWRHKLVATSSVQLLWQDEIVNNIERVETKLVSTTSNYSTTAAGRIEKKKYA